MAERTKAPKGWIIAGVVFLLLGLGGCATAIVGVSSLASLADDITNTTAYGETTSFTSESDAGALVLLTTDGECVGVDGSGADIVFETPSGNFTVDTGTESFNHARTFDTVDGQTYELACGDPLGATAGTYTVLRLPSLLSGAAGALILAGGSLGGALFLLLGVVFLVIGLVRRSRWKKNQTGFAAAGGGVVPPPGAVTPPPPGGFAPTGGAVPPAPGAVPPPPGAVPPPAAPAPAPGAVPPPAAPAPAPPSAPAPAPAAPPPPASTPAPAPPPPAPPSPAAPSAPTEPGGEPSPPPPPPPPA